MKAFTDLEQSKKLAEFLPLESADCYWDYDEMQKFHRISWFEDGYNKESQLMLNENNVCAWSLVALIKMLPKGFLLMDAQNEADLYSVWVPGFNDPHIWKDNPLDATFEMIVWLKENKKI